MTMDRVEVVRPKNQQDPFGSDIKVIGYVCTDDWHVCEDVDGNLHITTKNPKTGNWRERFIVDYCESDDVEAQLKV